MTEPHLSYMKINLHGQVKPSENKDFTMDKTLMYCTPLISVVPSRHSYNM